jgi:hypothetical protein
MHTRALIAYAGRRVARPRYYANDHSRDVLDIAPVEMEITDARGREMSLDGAGFTLVPHRSAVADFTDRVACEAIYRAEIVALVAKVSGADLILVNSPGILRFSERSALSGALDNSRPARFAHVDVSDTTAAAFVRRAAPAACRVVRSVHYNIWRVVSAPPQDVALAVCDARTVSSADLIAADAVFDAPGKPEWSFEGLVVAHARAHRWHWFPNMHREEAILFKTHDSEPGYAHCVPHVAFDNPLCAADAPARVSIEMRALALWFA